MINRWSTAGFVPPSVQIPGNALHEKVLQRQKSVGPLVNSQDEGALLVPVINRLSTAGFVPPSVPGHALHEEGLQKQKGVVPLVGSQENRALLVPVINRLSTADFVPPSVYIGFRLFVLLEGR